jgi:hypothetical protein
MGGGKGWFLAFLRAFFEGVMEKTGVFAWCFRGEVVVIAW